MDHRYYLEETLLDYFLGMECKSWEFFSTVITSSSSRQRTAHIRGGTFTLSYCSVLRVSERSFTHLIKLFWCQVIELDVGSKFALKVMLRFCSPVKL
jgi:hypothetical protein